MAAIRKSEPQGMGNLERHLQASLELGSESRAGTPRPASWNTARLHEASEAIRQHMLPLLTFSEVARLSRTCMDWHQLISTTPVHQLSAECQKGLMPAGITSYRSFKEVLQRRSALMARLRGKLPPNISMQCLSLPGHALKDVSWSPQSDLDQPSQWIQSMQLQYKPSDEAFDDIVSIDVVDLASFQPANTQAQAHNDPAQPVPAQLPGQSPTLTCDSDLKTASHPARHPLHAVWACQETSAKWTAEGRHLVVLARPVRGPVIPADPACELDSSQEAMNARLSPMWGTLLVVNAVDKSEIAAGSKLAITAHGSGKLSPARDVLLWSTFPSSASLGMGNQQVAAFRLPDLQLLYQVQAPIDLFMFELFINDEPMIKTAEEILWSPDAQQFAVHWAMVGHLSQSTPAGINVTVQIASSSHGFSIHAAKDGRCLGSHEMVDPRGYTWAPCAGSQWDPTSSYLIYVGPDGLCGRVDVASRTGALWMSTLQQRGFQPDPTRKALIRCCGSPSGRYVCVIDDFADAPKNNATSFCAQVSILKASTGSIVYQHKVAGRIGELTWADGRDVCLLSQLGVVMAASSCVHDSLGKPSISNTMSAPAWRNYVLPDAFHPLEEPDACACAACWQIRAHHYSPCGSIVVGMMLKKGMNNKVPLSHWHLAGSTVSRASVQLANGSPQPRPILPNMSSLVWHPQQHACVYAISDMDQGIHIIDARADQRVGGWTRKDLIVLAHEQGLPANSDFDLPALAWSHDGAQLAVFFAQIGVVLSF